jgi:hypothetical protein
MAANPPVTLVGGVEILYIAQKLLNPLAIIFRE